MYLKLRQSALPFLNRYFFTEMFDHFRLFFVWTFQLNLAIYLAPLAIRFPLNLNSQCRNSKLPT